MDKLKNTFELIKSKIENVSGDTEDFFMGSCPIPNHEDKKPSFNAKLTEDKILLNCYGCNAKIEEFTDALGIRQVDLFKKSSSMSGKPVTFEYKDAEGKTLYTKTKGSDGNYYFNRVIDGKAITGLSEGKYYSNNKGYYTKRKTEGDFIDAPRQEAILYNLDQVTTVIKEGMDIPIIVTEGEKDVETLKKLGYIATSSPTGAKGWKKEYGEYLKDAKEILLCGDNDDTGREYLQEVADTMISLNVKTRLIELPNKYKGYDVSDYIQEGHKAEEFQKLISLAKEVETGREPFEFPFVDAEGKPLKKWENLQAILKHENIDVKYNKLKKTVEVSGDLWANDIITDGRVTDIGGLCEDRGLKLSKDLKYDFISRISMANAYHPVQEYLLNCLEKHQAKGSTGDLVEQLYSTIELVEDSPTKFKLFRYWLRNAVAVAFNQDERAKEFSGSKDGTISANGVLTFLGEEGIGKSRWIRSIVPTELNAFKDNVFIDPTNKDTIITATKYWIGELAELDSMTTKKEQSRLKGFLTSVTDDYRIPYARTSEELPRYSIYYGSVNKEEFLKDDTANRRYWTLEIVKADHQHNIELDALWGQLAYEVMVLKEKYWLDTEEIKDVSEINENHRSIDNVELSLTSGYDWEVIEYDELEGLSWEWKTSTEITEELGLSGYDNSQIGRAYSKILKNMGYDMKQIDKRFRKRKPGKRLMRMPSGEADLRYRGLAPVKPSPEDVFSQEMDARPSK